MAAVEETTITVAGVRSLVRRAGPQDAREAVVFLHGNPGSSADWTALLAQTGEQRRALAPDMPGFGQAERPADFAYDVAGYAAHLQALLEALEVERAHLVLHDFGGPWGLTWAAAHPTRVASLTLCNMGVLPGFRWHRFALLWRTPLLGELSMALTPRWLFRALLNHENPRPLPPEHVRRMADDFDAGARRAVLRLYRATPPEGLGVTHLAPALAALDVPVLVLWGAADRFVPVRFAEEQARVFKRCEVHRFEGCGHWPFLDDPERAAALLGAFLAAQP